MGRHTENIVLTITRTASGAVTTRRFVKNSGAQCTTRGERPIGVATDGAVDGALFPVAIEGIVLVESAGAVSQDVPVMTDASGKAILATAGKYIAGISMGAVTGSGQLLPILLGSEKMEMVRTTTTTTTSTTTSTSTTTTTTAP